MVGPYTLYAACYSSTFDPNKKNKNIHQENVPEFEPNLKAGGTWTCRLAVPETIQKTAGKASARNQDNRSVPSVTWIIDIASQVIFSMSATVNYELLVGRDEKSLGLGFLGTGSKDGALPGKIEDHSLGKMADSPPKGVFSSSIGMVVDNTQSLWNKPAFPTWDVGTGSSNPPTTASSSSPPKKDHDHDQQKQKKVHLVVLTHGLHSNLGADMLYLKESIDAAAKQAREDARKRRRQRTHPPSASKTQASSGDDHTTSFDQDAEESDEEEEVIVRGFANNACRTERGIQYLGKRLAKWVLSITYPDQEYLPQRQSMKKKLSRVFTADQRLEGQQPGVPMHNHSSIYHPTKIPERKPYRISSISFIAHSLGGLTQTYAIAYIHKHSPEFFKEIKPINFVAMAAPFLGLSNENPLYVRFALDFGLVGRTGQDLGLAWRAPTMVRSGWGAMIGGMGAEGQKTHKQLEPGSKPLLRILPTGHTHEVLKLFRNRTVYSNVVNDGIVPLRTSCLLFLDWSGLGRVEKARRENGLIGTTLGWGWAELTGANSRPRTHLRADRDSEIGSQSDISAEDNLSRVQSREGRAEVPQPAENTVADDNTFREKKFGRSRSVDTRGKSSGNEAEESEIKRRSSVQHQLTSPINTFMSFLRPNPPNPPKSPRHSPKQTRIYRRGQVTKSDLEESSSIAPESPPSISRSASPNRPGPVRGPSFLDEDEGLYAPPKTSIFESAGDVLNPPLPTKEFIINPDTRPTTIFHDRVYHPTDIPPPPARRPRRLSRSSSSDSRNGVTTFSPLNEQQVQQKDLGDMKVEEKIARAYHHGLSWRKVLVRLEPDAHNNMVVRRMFANAYGWPVIKHLVDTHFADTWEARTADVWESNEEHAKPLEGEEELNGLVGEAPPLGHFIKAEIHRTDSEMREATDSIADLKHPRESNSKSSSFSHKQSSLSREDSARWDDALFEVTDDSEDESPYSEQRTRRPHVSPPMDDGSPNKGTSEAEIADFLTRSPLPADSPTASPKGKEMTAPAGGTTTLGLRRSLEEQLGSK